MSECRQVRAAVEMAARRDELAAGVTKHLAACAPCNVYATETFSVMALLSSQPRVEAPADFDFRLRARIARARDEQQSFGGSFKSFWTRTFSLQRAAAMLALLAFGVTSTTLYLSRSANLSPTPTAKSGQTDATPLVSQVITPAQPLPQADQPPAARAGSVETNRRLMAAVGSSGGIRPARSMPAVEHKENRATSEAQATSAQAASMDTQEVLIYRPGSTRVVNVPRGQVVWGAQLAGMRQSTGTRTATQMTVATF